MAADLSDAIRYRMETDATFAALVGGTGDAARVFPLQLPQRVTYPAVTYQLISRPRLYAGGGNAGLTPDRVQFGIYDPDFADVVSVAQALKTLWEAFVGTVAATAGNVVILGVHFLDERDFHEAAADTAGRYVRQLDARMWWQEP